MLFIILVLLFAQETLAQQKQFTQIDSSVSAGITYYFLQVGKIENQKKTGEWSGYQYSSADTIHILTWKANYEKNKLQKEEHYNLKGKTERLYGKRNKLVEENYYRYGNKVWQYQYDSKKLRSVKMFYANGVVSSEGKQVSVRVMEGCDAGLHIFLNEGKWTYFDESGVKIDEIIHSIDEGKVEID